MSAHVISTLATRTEVCPPAPRDPALARWWRWLTVGTPLSPWHDPRLEALRNDIRDCVDDLPRAQRADLVEMSRHARSLRELWHLRPALFGAIALAHSEDEAQRRLALLNRHFPTRSPRSGFGGFEAG